MPIGDLITGDWQIQVGDLLIGDGTDYDIRVIEGLASMPEVRPQDRPLLLRHGSVSGLDYLGERDFTVELDVVESNTDTLAALLDALSLAWRPTTTEVPIAFQVPGVAGGAPSVVFGRVRRRDIPIGVQFSRGLAEVALEVACTDPRVYSVTEHSTSTGVASSEGGLTFDAVADFTFGDVSTGGAMSLLNAGTFDAPVTFVIEGPCTSPVIENVTVDKTLRFDIVLSAGERLFVNTKERTVLLGGTSTRYFALRTTSEWFDLVPGPNAINYLASSDIGSTLTATWRSAWS